MSTGPERAAPHLGRHRAPPEDQVGRALRRALVATLAPAPVLGLIGWIVVRSASGRIVDLLVDSAALLWVVVAIAVVWALWVTLIWRTYARSRPRAASLPTRLGGAFGVALMCAAITAPMAVGARYAVVQRDLIDTVFGDEASATAPKATAASPWGKRKRVNVLLLGGDGAIHRPGVRTDSVMLASIDTSTGRTVLFSLPRNLRNVPFRAGSELAELYPDGFSGGSGEAEYYLNAIYRNVPALHPGVLGRSDNEGADAVKLAVSGVLGIRVDYYVLVNLSGFEQLVDAIGGITVNINEPVPIGGNSDLGIPPEDYLDPGPNQKLDGFEALWFTRGRYGSSDYKRMERQRCAINAIVAEASPVTMLRRYTRLARASKQIVRTDIPSSLLPAFVELAAKVKSQPIRSVGFERSEEFDPNAPDFDYVREAVQAALKPARRAPVTEEPVPAAGGATASAEPVPSRASDATEDCAYRAPTDVAAG